jgi:hypothetical protein
MKQSQENLDNLDNMGNIVEHKAPVKYFNNAWFMHR